MASTSFTLHSLSIGMDESIYAGAYWTARGESLAACADRVWLLLTRIKEINPLFELWYPKKKSTQEPTNSSIKTREEVQTMLSEKRNRRDDNGEIIEQLGFSFSAWNGEHDESKGLEISTHLGGTSAWVKNNLVVRLPRGQYRLTEEQTQTLLKVIIDVSVPDYATISSHQCRDKLQVKKEFIFGWMGYVKVKVKASSSSRVEVHTFGNGTLLTAKVAQFSSADEHQLVAVKELNDIIRQAGWRE
jgi:hypothetical protein